MTKIISNIRSDFIVNPEFRMWGKYLQDLRVELVDSQNHHYTIHKDMKRNDCKLIPANIAERI